jgi:hypothetical protein
MRFREPLFVYNVLPSSIFHDPASTFSHIRYLLIFAYSIFAGDAPTKIPGNYLANYNASMTSLKEPDYSTNYSWNYRSVSRARLWWRLPQASQKKHHQHLCQPPNHQEANQLLWSEFRIIYEKSERLMVKYKLKLTPCKLHKAQKLADGNELVRRQRCRVRKLWAASGSWENILFNKRKAIQDQANV